MISKKQNKQQIGIIVLVCCCFFLLFWNFSTQNLLGYHGGEVYGHAWTHWWRLQGFPAHFFGTDQALGVKYFPPIDIIPIIVSNCFGMIGGTVFGYNIWIIVSVFFAGFGGYYLAKTEGGEPWIGGFVLALSPIFLGTIHSGLTEDMGIGLVAIAIALLRKRSKWGVLALASVGYCGLVLGWMTGIVALIIGLIDIRRNRNNLMTWMIFGFGTLILLSPLFWIHWERLGHQGHRFGTHIMGFEPFWGLNPWKQTDVASLFRAGQIDFSGEIIRLHPAYLGISLLLLAGFSRARFWWSIFLMFTLFSFGSSFRFWGADREILNPVIYLLEQIPGYSLINHHGRFMLLSLVAWSVLAAKGAKHFQKWMPLFGILVVVSVDLIVLSPIGFSLPKTNSYSDTILEQIDLQEGEFLLRLPMLGPEISFQEALWEQAFHQEELLLSPNRPGIQPFTKKTERTAWIERLAFSDAQIPESFCIPKQAGGVLVLAAWSDQIEEKLGKPDLKDQRYSFWRISSQASYICN